MDLVHKGQGKAKRSSKATSRPRPSLAACWRPWECAASAARSPQAKGRIERLWRTLQNRLVIAFRLAGIRTVEAANDFLGTYAEQLHNPRFAGAPARNGSRAPLRQHPRGAGIFTLLNP
ncbi:hypothetical protein TDMWS_05720 [Thermodesulfomicrobium sp. WS]|nr:hypothetical protein TDMWS_05720 [Thermodesulfomicrobium sp. WS]